MWNERSEKLLRTWAQAHIGWRSNYLKIAKCLVEDVQAGDHRWMRGWVALLDQAKRENPGQHMEALLILNGAFALALLMLNATEAANRGAGD